MEAGRKVKKFTIIGLKQKHEKEVHEHQHIALTRQ